MKVIKNQIGTFSAIDYADFASHIKVSYSGSVPADLSTSLLAAFSYVDQLSWQPLATRSISFIASTWANEYEYSLELAGTLSSPTCTYYDASNVSQTLVITSSWLENTGEFSSILHVIAASYPAVYDRSDAITVSFTVTPFSATLPSDLKMAIYLLGAYYYDCRVNDKEVMMTVVDKIILSVRHKEF